MQDIADLVFWISFVFGSVVCFALGFIGGQQR